MISKILFNSYLLFCYFIIILDLSQQEPCLPHGSVVQFNLPDYVQIYCSDLKTRYIQQSVLPDSDWPPSLGRQYIRLALIRQERQLSNHTYESVIEHQIDYTRGDYDKIMKHKTKIELINAFEEIICEGGKKMTLKMLIDGAPGVGKTTLSRKISNMWAKGEILQNYWLVLLLHLRERAISNAKTIDEFFYHDDSDLNQSVIKCVKERSGDGILIIFDGFDELSSYERSNESLFLDISRGKILPKCAVVITSRPYASRTLQELPIINRHIEVLGFTDQQVEVCIHQKIKDQNRAEAFCTELKDRLDVASICQIPLNCSIVLYVYEQEKYRLPRTLTELYELFILHSLKRFLKRTLSDEDSEALQTFDELPSSYGNHFLSLCELAFQGLKDDKLVFSKNNVKAVFSIEFQGLHAHLPLLDLMTSAKSFSSRGPQNTYSFLHLTIQEFLGAYWIAHYMSDSDRLNFFQQNLSENRFRMVLLFLSGLTKLVFPNVTSLFNQMSWKKDKVHICHLIYEAENQSLCKYISENYCNSSTGLIMKLNGISKFDRLVELSLVAYSECRWKDVQLVSYDINIVNRVFSSERMHSASTSIENVSVAFHSTENNIDLTLLRLLDELQCISSVSIIITLSGKTNQQHSDKSLISHLSKVFTEPQMVHNKDYSIYLEGCNEVRRSWTLATIHSSNIVARFCKTVAKCLIKNACVKKIVLKEVFPTDIKDIFTTLNDHKSVSCLEHLACTKGYISTTKKRPDDVCVPFKDFCTILAAVISHNTSLKELELPVFSGNQIDKSGICTIKCALQNNTTLQKLTLIPEQLLFERNNETGVMELKCTQDYKENLSITPSLILCGSNKRKTQNELLSLNMDAPSAKRPCSCACPQSVSTNVLTCAKTVSLQSEMDTLDISSHSHSQVLMQSPAIESSSAGPLTVSHLISTTTSDNYNTTGHQVTLDQTQFSYAELHSRLSVSQTYQTTIPLPVSSHYHPQESRQNAALECSLAGPLHVSHDPCPSSLIPHGSRIPPSSIYTLSYCSHLMTQPQSQSSTSMCRSAEGSGLPNTLSLRSSNAVGCTEVIYQHNPIFSVRPHSGGCHSPSLSGNVLQPSQYGMSTQQQRPFIPYYRAPQVFVVPGYNIGYPVQSLTQSPRSQQQEPIIHCVQPQTSMLISHPQPVQQSLPIWMWPQYQQQSDSGEN